MTNHTTDHTTCIGQTSGQAGGQSDAALVAVATSDGSHIDEHFGEADAFAIFEVHAGGVGQVGRRVVDDYRTPGRGDEDRRDVIVRALSDCVACFVARIGDAPGKKLTAAGIEPVSKYAEGNVEAALTAWFEGYRPV